MEKLSSMLATFKPVRLIYRADDHSNIKKPLFLTFFFFDNLRKIQHLLRLELLTIDE